MPMHDWTKVEAGIFHAFHHRWISAISDALNQGSLPADYYALPEQVAAGFGPDVLTLQGGSGDAAEIAEDTTRGGTATALRTRPQSRFTAQTEAEFYRRKKSSIVVRHVSGDRIVAMLEIVSPGNKSNRAAFHAFVEKASELLEHRIHLLIVDQFTTRASIEPIAVGQPLPDMPLFLEPNGCIMVPLEATYETAFSVLPRRWQKVLAPAK